MGTIAFKAGYIPEHGDSPVLPKSGLQLAALLDEMNSSRNENCNYLTIFCIDSDGSHRAQMGVGIRAGDSAGSLYYIGPEGDSYSIGSRVSDVPIAYYDFGNERLFAPGSQIPLDAMKNALVQLFDRKGARPDCVEWQEWQGWIADLDDDDDDDVRMDSTAQAPSPDFSDPPF